MRTEITDFKPSEIRVNVPVGEILFRTGSQEAENAAVELSPMVEGDEQALKAIQDAIVTQQGDRWSISVPLQESGGNSNVFVGGTAIQMSGASVIVSGGGSITVNGRTIAVGGGGVQAVVHASKSVHADLRTQAGMIDIDGDLRKLTIEGTSGRIQQVGRVAEADVEVSSGTVALDDIDVLNLRGSSGTLRVNRVRESGRIRASSGTISAYTTTADFRARASSGTVHVVTAPGVRLDPDNVSVSSGTRHVTSQ